MPPKQSSTDHNGADQSSAGASGADQSSAGASGAGASSAPFTPPKTKRPPLSNYRMALLGSNGIRRYYETGYIPDVLQD